VGRPPVIPRSWRRLAAVLSAATVTLTMAVAGPAAAAPGPAVADYGGCLLAQRAGDLLILFDESGSLRTTDKDDARVTAASYLVRQLLTYSQQNKVNLEVGVAGFADTYRDASPWTALDPAGASRVQHSIADFKARKAGFETDYWNALNGARQALVQQAADNPNRCQAIVWFTDGRLSLTKRDQATERLYGQRKTYAPDTSLRTKAGVAAAEGKALDDLCRPQGLADQLRARHITMLAMGLTSPLAPDSDFASMRRIAEAGPSCGKVQAPPGKFWPVGDINSMLDAFDQVANPYGQQTRRFVLDDALNRVHVFGTGKPGLRYTLVAPGNKRLELTGTGPQRRSMLGGHVEVSWEWESDQTLSADLRRVPGKPWTGIWSVHIVDTTGARSGPDPRITLSGDLYPAWSKDNAAKLRSGDQPAVTFQLADTDGKTIQPRDLRGNATLNASLVSPDGNSVPFAHNLNKDQISQPQTLDLRNTPVGHGTVRLELTYTTAKVGNISTTLDPQQVNVTVTILPAPGRGRILDSFNFGSTDQPVDKTASVQVQGPSCVWLPVKTLQITAAPADINPVTITSDHRSGASCLSVPAGQTAPLTARLTTGAAGNGSLVGAVEVQQAPLGEPGRASAVQVPVSAEMAKPLKVFNFLLALIVALLLGPGIPLALLYLVKFWTAKIPGHPLEALRVPVTIDNGQLLHRGTPLTYDSLPRAQAVDLLRKGSRTADAAGIALRARAGLSPFGAGYVEAVLPGESGVSSSHVHPHGRRRAARLPLAVHNTWAAFHDPSGPPENATVLLLRGLDVTRDQRRAQFDDVKAQLPGLVGRLRPRAGPTPPPGTSSPDDPSGFGVGVGSAPPTSTRPSPSAEESSTPSFDFGFGDDGSKKT
jgi:Mg-chelatase subunit ChlD